jgi:large subunit ribosomal protein L24
MANAGAEAGKTGKVLQVLAGRGRVVVEGLNVGRKTLRRSPEAPQGGMMDRERSMALSNVQLYCPDCKKGVRLTRARDGERSVRKCRACGHQFDS